MSYTRLNILLEEIRERIAEDATQSRPLQESSWVSTLGSDVVTQLGTYLNEWAKQESIQWDYYQGVNYDNLSFALHEFAQNDDRGVLIKAFAPVLTKMKREIQREGKRTGRK